jgi:hypothetical protein
VVLIELSRVTVLPGAAPDRVTVLPGAAPDRVTALPGVGPDLWTVLPGAAALPDMVGCVPISR